MVGEHFGERQLRLKFGGGLSSHYGSDQVIGAFKIGIGYEVELTQHWSFTPGIEVYGKGAKNPNQTAYVFDPDHNQLYNPDTGQPLTGVINRSATPFDDQADLVVHDTIGEVFGAIEVR